MTGIDIAIDGRAITIQREIEKNQKKYSKNERKKINRNDFTRSNTENGKK